jgi:hypothetical protein
MYLFASLSVDITVGLPSKLVLKIGPYLKQGN